MSDSIIEEFWSKKKLQEENNAMKEQVAYMQECLDAQPICPLHWKDYLILFLVMLTVASSAVAGISIYLMCNLH